MDTGFFENNVENYVCCAMLSAEVFMSTDHSKVRVWQTHFSVHRPFSSLPQPELVVEEVQNTPAYRMDGHLRHEGGSQLVITLGGSGGIRVAGEDFPLPCGRAFLHNHNDPDICYYYPHNGREVWNFIWIAFYGGNSEELVAEINRNYGYLFDLEPNSELISLLKDYKKYSGEIQQLSPLEGAQLIYHILEILCRPVSEKNKSSARSVMIGEIQSLITADPAAELQVEKIAARFKVTREHLSRIFREETGIPLHEYIIRTRLKMAVSLLLRTHLSVKEVSARCGWNDYSVFYRIFKKRFNCPPQNLRGRSFK